MGNDLLPILVFRIPAQKLVASQNSSDRGACGFVLALQKPATETFRPALEKPIGLHRAIDVFAEAKSVNPCRLAVTDLNHGKLGDMASQKLEIRQSSVAEAPATPVLKVETCSTRPGEVNPADDRSMKINDSVFALAIRVGLVKRRGSTHNLFFGSQSELHDSARCRKLRGECSAHARHS
jgi:hypothetical protein